MGYSGAGGKLIHEKNQRQKSRDTVLLMTPKNCFGKNINVGNAKFYVDFKFVNAGFQKYS
jgi:hypothetical protein